VASAASVSPEYYFETVNSREFRQRIQEIVAGQNASRAAKKKPPVSEISKLSNAEAFRERIQDIVKRQQLEAVEAAARKPPASETRKPKLRRKAK